MSRSKKRPACGHPLESHATCDHPTCLQRADELVNEIETLRVSLRREGAPGGPGHRSVRGGGTVAWMWAQR
jgi:hypothetical protein